MPRNTRRFWRLPETVAKLHALYPAASWQELCAAFPGRTHNAIHKGARRIGVSRRVLPDGPVKAEPLIRALRRRRLQLKISQVVLSRQMGVQRNFIGEHECGAKDVSYRALKKWCAALGVTLQIALVVSPVQTRMQQQALVDMQEWKRRHDRADRATGAVVKKRKIG